MRHVIARDLGVELVRLRDELLDDLGAREAQLAVVRERVPRDVARRDGRAERRDCRVARAVDPEPERAVEEEAHEPRLRTRRRRIIAPCLSSSRPRGAPRRFNAHSRVRHAACGRVVIPYRTVVAPAPPPRAAVAVRHTRARRRRFHQPNTHTSSLVSRGLAGGERRCRRVPTGRARGVGGSDERTRPASSTRAARCRHRRRAARRPSRRRAGRTCGST